MGVSVSIGLVILLAAGLVWLGSGVSGGRTNSQEEILAEKVRSLQADLQQKELALVVQEKRLKEMQEGPTLAVAPPPRSGSDIGSGRGQVPGREESRENSPLTSIQEAFKPPASGPSKTLTGDDDLEESESSPGVRATPGRGTGGAASGAPDLFAGEIGSAPKNLVNFNAQEVSAAGENPSNGVLSFRLIKDHPDIRFSGYLFVFVEMADQRGENKIYAYPKQARLGEEDLPVDFREGESISFKHNSRVELPYEDIRSGASLARVSILLYGENGKIVFQRGFDRRELKTVTQKSNAPRPAASDSGRHRASDKRRAL